MKRPLPAILTPLLALGMAVACSSQEDQTPGNEADLSAPIIGNEDGAVEEENGGSNVTAPASMTGAADEEESSDRIPVAMRGRWGLVAADCTSRHGDAKGLLEISGATLTFYESRGTLKDFIEWAPGHVRAEFDFSGEGMTWQREMSLSLKNDGRTLVRQEYGKDAAPAPLSYRRCPA